ncbi:Uncharacterised protein [Burkholderia pseudomallei]|nr:Uncharacterised protein [Burkholderia pseudomallei]CAJ6733225.1 Uncharacterised protein [Burkholderia pseudomallei]CAJ8106919.1 Uncharacterised protein [Burkholderia pseudomallei]CAJ9298682.1 Uncharacterised protein [Burkholderia pseudomallei]CAJ9966590.1 Uncharacterised protein [Burkholderia pseudomallei]
MLARLEECRNRDAKGVSQVLQIDHHWAGRFVLQPADVRPKSMGFDRECFLTEPCLTAQPFHIRYYPSRGVFPGWFLFADRPVTEEVEHIHAQYIS